MADKLVQSGGLTLVKTYNNTLLGLWKVNEEVLTNYEQGQVAMVQKSQKLWQGEKLKDAANLVLTETQKPVDATGNFFHRVKIAYDTAYAIIIDKEPTKISDVSIEEVGGDYAIISFKTNHPAWGKVNYGDSLSYGREVMLPEREYEHQAKLTGLEKGKKYFFEVMAQNKNYAYDAYYVVEIPN